MAEIEVDACGRDHLIGSAAAAAAGEGAAAGSDVEAIAVTPEGGDWLGDEKKVCRAEEGRFFVKEDKSGDFAVVLGDSVKVISVAPEGRDQRADGEVCGVEESPVGAEEVKRSGYAVDSGECSESGDVGTCCVANGGEQNKVSCTFGGGFCSKDVGLMCDMSDEPTEHGQCGWGILVGEGGDGSGMVEVKISDDDLQMACEEVCRDNGGFLDLRKLDNEQSPYGADCVRSTTDADHELEKDDLLPKNNAEVSMPVAEVCVPSDGVVEVKTSNEDLQMACEQASYDNGGLSDLGKLDSERLPHGADGVRSTTDAGHEVEKDDLLPKFDVTVSRLVAEASVPSISESCIDVSLDGKSGWLSEISENKIGMEKLTCGLWKGDMLCCKHCFWTEESREENQQSRMEVSERMICFDCKAAIMECSEAIGSSEIDVSLQQTEEQKDGSSKFHLKRDLSSSSYVQPCKDVPCCSGKESSESSAGVESSPLGHLIQEFNVCNSADANACSGDFVENVHAGESQNPKSAPLLVFRRRNPTRAASSRSTNLDKPDQLNKARNSAGKSKKADSASSLHLSTLVKFPNKTTRRRSGLNRLLKYAVWGSLQNLLDGFGKKCDLSTSDSDPTWLGNGRSKKKSSDGQRQPCIRKSRSSRFSKNKYAVPSDIGCANNVLNGQPAFHIMTDIHASSEGYREQIPKSASHASINVSDDIGKTSQHTEDKHTVKLKSVQTDRQLLERDLESTVTQETHSEYNHAECTKLPTPEPSLKNGIATLMLDPGSSPDSVVYNPVLEVASVTCESDISANHDVIVCENLSVPGALAQDGAHTAVLSASDFARKHALSLADLEQRAKTEGNKSMKKVEIDPSSVMIGNHLGEGSMQASEKPNAEMESRSLREHECKKKDGSKQKNRKSINSTKGSSRKASKLRAFSNDSSLLDSSELMLHTGSPKFDSCPEAQTSSERDPGGVLHEHDNTQSSLLTANDKGDTFGSKKSMRHKKTDSHRGRKGGKARNPDNEGKNKKRSLAADAIHGDGSISLPSQPATELAASELNELSKPGPATELALKNSTTISTEVCNKTNCGLDGISVQLPPRAAWVCCDDCQKWRCIPAELVDIIGETNCRWTCKDNKDKAFGDCSIPQEKTNAEINAELELSDASGDEDNNPGSTSRACKPPSWTHIRSNLFLHRNRRTQSIDESMVCNCKPRQDGRLGCGDGCLNRILNIECVKRTCPCGDLCSNQQFQRRNYSKLRWFHSGKKGYGLQLKENVSEGQFLIEYVGEVLDLTAYESRQRYYASKGQKHFYFMALNGGEVIDACTKGNLGRFINHSCSPNCRTEKWMVNGEVCIGIFAMRNIKKGEELTFDYNYVRVSGAAPQKCFCGTAKCRGYIGGDMLDADIIAQGDTEAGYFEDVDVDIDAEKVLGTNECSSRGTYLDVVEHEEKSVEREVSNNCLSAFPELEPCQQTGGNLSDISEPENSLQALSPQEDEDIVRTPVHVSQTMESSLQHFSVPGIQSAEFLQKAPNLVNGSTPSTDADDNRLSDFHANSENNFIHNSNLKRSSSPIGNAKDSTTSPGTFLLRKEKRMANNASSEHLWGVERRLNKLLDADGGISKRKDATNGYLKLLLVTAAEGDNAGGASKSVRDLSLILGALLKTKSHTVLLDIINKNGLQMLHNMLKQNRGSFHRIPIIRKLLKVLEFLASKGILTFEHINGGPRCAGMESFRESMLGLTRHSDSQVHRIARDFRDRWIPRTMTRSEPTEREGTHFHSQRNCLDKLQTHLANCQYDRGRMEPDPPAQNIQGISTAGGPVSLSTCTDCKSTSRRKRKSHWDQQSDDHYKMVGLKIRKASSEQGEFDLQIGSMRNRFPGNWGTDSCYDVPYMRSSTTENADDDVPPGFGSQQECQPPQISSDWGVAPGFCQERYQPHLSISYGIPVALVQHLGTPEAEGVQHHKRWKIAPGVPFHPFPPLPPYPRGEPDPSTSSTQISQLADQTVTEKHNNSGHYQRTVDGRVHRNWRNGGRGRWSSNYQGRRLPRQWNNHHRFERHRPPWPQEHGGSGSRCRE